ncbi:hypothetical protein J1N35_028138 [Gossypium stocksii]|uniref:Wax synthase domain-containing protein n=1 Tax=Gossypium stocksii TaxID=47602 RepID=A0A9D3UVB9_9ROSI|nr:hypothetical protein J1N35_028138 [Gossypium stocksii]
MWASLPAIIAVFVVSGLMHELIYYYLTRVAPTWEVTWFFILHGVAVAAEVVVKKVVPEKVRLNPVVSGALAWGFVAVTAVWLFLPQLLRNGVDEKTIGEYCKLMNLLKFARHMSTEHTVLSVPGTNILDGLRTGWTRV